MACLGREFSSQHLALISYHQCWGYVSCIISSCQVSC